MQKFKGKNAVQITLKRDKQTFNANNEGSSLFSMFGRICFTDVRSPVQIHVQFVHRQLAREAVIGHYDLASGVLQLGSIKLP